MFIEVTLEDGSLCSIDIAEIVYFSGVGDSLCNIVLHTNDISLYTTTTYSEIKKLIDMELNK